MQIKFADYFGNIEGGSIPLLMKKMIEIYSTSQTDTISLSFSGGKRRWNFCEK